MKNKIVLSFLATAFVLSNVIPAAAHADEAAYGQADTQSAIGEVSPNYCEILDSSLYDNKNNFSLVLEISDGYDVSLTEDGSPLIEFQGNLENCLFSSAISTDGKRVCITGATGEETFDRDIEIKIYFYNNYQSNVLSIQSNPAISNVVDNATADSIQATNVNAIYGDVNADGIANSVDSSLILTALSSNGGNALLTAHLYNTPSKKAVFFPYAISALCPDCYQASDDGVVNLITDDDAQEILTASAHAGLGTYYNTRVGTLVGGMIDYSGNIPSVATTVYEKTLNVPFVDNPDGVCWLSSILSKHNYMYNTNLSLDNAKAQLLAAYPNSGPLVGNMPWIQRACNYFNVGFHYISHPGTYVDMYGQINYNNPVYMGLGDHAVLLRGVKIKSDGTGEYTVMDPNYPYYRTINLTAAQMNSSSTSSSFTYYLYDNMPEQNNTPFSWCYYIY